MKCDMCGKEKEQVLEAVIPQDEYEGFKAFLCKQCIDELEKASNDQLRKAKKRILASINAM